MHLPTHLIKTFENNHTRYVVLTFLTGSAIVLLACFHDFRSVFLLSTKHYPLTPTKSKQINNTPQNLEISLRAPETNKLLLNPL